MPDHLWAPCVVALGSLLTVCHQPTSGNALIAAARTKSRPEIFAVIRRRGSMSSTVGFVEHLRCSREQPGKHPAGVQRIALAGLERDSQSSIRFPAQRVDFGVVDTLCSEQSDGFGSDNPFKYRLHDGGCDVYQRRKVSKFQNLKVRISDPVPDWHVFLFAGWSLPPTTLAAE